jgi:hypothetical protein
MSLRAFSGVIHRAKPMAKATAAVNASRWLGVKVTGDKAQVEIAPLPAYKTDGPASTWVDTTVSSLTPPGNSTVIPYVLTRPFRSEQKQEVTQSLYEMIRKIARFLLSKHLRSLIVNHGSLCMSSPRVIFPQPR